MLHVSSFVVVLVIIVAASVMVGIVFFRRTKPAPVTLNASEIRSAIARCAATGEIDRRLTHATVDRDLFEREMVQALRIVSGSARDQLSSLAINFDLLAAWAALLRTGDVQQRLEALDRLALLSDGSVIPTLSAALSDGSASVRVRAAQLLRELGVELR